MNDKSLTKRQQYWLSHVKACQQQNLSVKEYAEQEGLELRTLYQAKSQLVKAGIFPGKKKSKFQKVTIKAMPAHCIITLPNGIRLEWPTNSNVHSLTLLGSIVDQLHSK